ncbi:vacuolar protein sorting-associated protein 74 [Neofusicoccum parvum]|uniref:Acyl carrier protein n=1 Tax=Botryosphaeria parva (strain UCR-NP2) TaxID=1287680 RepID=R1GE85_BOTPV|nr:putative vacuolar protein sorting-associated protein 74 protein [Neofusicoccum parvum UCRNP2]GME40326.1 vacuolar protein sorting-associated protein 74 [Neofusicoccum parvum]
MFRTAILRSARGAARSVARWQAPIARPVVPTLRAQSRQQLPAVCFQAVRCYSAGGALNQDEVQGRILDLLKNFDKVQDASKLSPTSHFSNDLGLDSLDTVEVVMAIEEEFSIEIPDKDADQIHSVDKAVEYILSQPDGAGAGANGDNDNDGSRVSSPVPRRNDDGPGTSYENSENGHKIAYDPRDISESAERSKQPKLTLMEEVLLMGLKDKQGYLSFWNDNISYALRGCIVIELAFRGRVSMQKDSSRRRFPLADRVIEVIDDTLTGEVLLDEALKMMKSSEKMSVASWIDLMSGETWNLMKIGYQLKQVRERLAKGLVDKGILRTEKRNFLLFDMATHPVADGGAKDEIRRRVRNLLTNRTVVLPPSQFLPEEMEFRYLRTIAMVCAAYAANVLENALSTLGHEARERAFAQVDELLAEYSQWPFARRAGGSGGIGANLGQVIQEEVNNGKDKELQLEVVAACLSVFTRLDSLL